MSTSKRRLENTYVAIIAQLDAVEKMEKLVNETNNLIQLAKNMGGDAEAVKQITERISADLGMRVDLVVQRRASIIRKVAEKMQNMTSEQLRNFADVSQPVLWPGQKPALDK